MHVPGNLISSNLFNADSRHYPTAISPPKTHTHTHTQVKNTKGTFYVEVSADVQGEKKNNSTKKKKDT